jgi:hypothetical protein
MVFLSSVLAFAFDMRHRRMISLCAQMSTHCFGLASWLSLFYVEGHRGLFLLSLSLAVGTFVFRKAYPQTFS